MHHACVPILLQTTVVSGKANRSPAGACCREQGEGRRSYTLLLVVYHPKATSRPGAESREQRGGARRSTTAVHIHIRSRPPIIQGSSPQQN